MIINTTRKNTHSLSLSLSTKITCSCFLVATSKLLPLFLFVIVVGKRRSSRTRRHYIALIDICIRGPLSLTLSGITRTASDILSLTLRAIYSLLWRIDCSRTLQLYPSRLAFQDPLAGTCTRLYDARVSESVYFGGHRVVQS